MIVVCAGMSRSGSTLQYQLISELVKLRGAGNAAGQWAYWKIPKVNDSNRIYVYKSERWLLSQKGSISHAFAIIRNPRDVAVSLYRYRLAKEYYTCKNGNTESLKEIIMGEMTQVMQWINWWEMEFGAYIIRYEDCYPDKWDKIIKQAAEVLHLEYSDDEIENIVDFYSLDENFKRMQSMENWLDLQDSQLTLAHISPNKGKPDEGKKILRPEEHVILEGYCKDFMERHGYL